jgi:hypothetical protein
MCLLGHGQWQSLIKFGVELHVLPFTRPAECWRGRLTIRVVAVYLAGGILGGVASPSHRQSRTGAICRGCGSVGHLQRRREGFRCGDKNSCRPAGTFTSWAWVIGSVAHVSEAAAALDVFEDVEMAFRSTFVFEKEVFRLAGWVRRRAPGGGGHW